MEHTIANPNFAGKMRRKYLKENENIVESLHAKHKKRNKPKKKNLGVFISN